MCGRITQKSSPKRLGLGLSTIDLVEPFYAHVPRYNGAPGQEHWVLRQNPKTGERTLDRLSWGLIPHWCEAACDLRSNDRMLVIIAPVAYERWISTMEPDPRDLLVPYPSEPMRIWPISTWVNKPENDDEQVLEPLKRSEDTLL